VYILPNIQTIVSLVLAALWFAGTIALYVRMRAKQVAYLKRFPPVEGVPLYMTGGGNPFGAVSRAVWSVMVRHQTDPELEALRREIWRRKGYMTLWIFGFPICAVGVTALLITTGVISVIAR
jgi:hypothetical protein